MRPILQCFSSVVGPNGSGKSNVIDAMLFMFGKRAKQVRPRPARKHNGAQRRSRLARVLRRGVRSCG